MQQFLRFFEHTDQLSQAFLVGVLILARVLPLLFQTPFLGGKLLPLESRMGLSVGLTLLLYPFAASKMSDGLNLGGIEFIVLLLKEFFIGFVIGFLASELFFAMDMAGRALDTTRGSNMAEVQVPEIQLRASPIGQLNFQLLLVVFCGVGGHRYFLNAVMESFAAVPIDGFPRFRAGMEPMIEEVMQYTASLFGIAFALVFPGIFATFMVDVVFGMLNKTAQQLNAYFMAMGIKAMAGIALFFFALRYMVEQLSFRLNESFEMLTKVIYLFG